METDIYISQRKIIVAIAVPIRMDAELFLQIGYKTLLIKELLIKTEPLIKNGTLKEDRIIIIILLMMANKSCRKLT
jgi:hypothetical protein